MDFTKAVVCVITVIVIGDLLENVIRLHYGNKKKEMELFHLFCFFYDNPI